MKVLISGATGSIGKELTVALCKAGHIVAIVVRDYHKAKSIYSTANDTQSLVIITIGTSTWAEEVVSFSPEVVIHLASLLTSRDDMDIIPLLIESNITFGAQLLQALKPTNFKLFVNTGTFAEYAFGGGELKPSYLYSASKTAFHSIIKYYQELSDFKVFNIIPYTVYGQADSQPKIIDIIYKSFFEKQPTPMSGGMQVLDFVHIDDVVAFYCMLVDKCATSKESWNDFHLGTGTGNTLRDVSRLMADKLQLAENINWGALPYRARDTMHAVAPIAKMANRFDWSPVTNLKTGIEKYLLKVSVTKANKL